MANTIIEKHSSVVNKGLPKLPTVSQLVHGQLAVNFADGYETISLKNSNNEIAVFRTKEQNDKIFINDSANMFSSFETENEYISASKNYPAISWVDETHDLRYEITEEQTKPRCNIKFKGGLEFALGDLEKNVEDATVIGILFNDAKPFETLQIEGIEHRDMNIPQLYKNLGSSVPSISAILEPGKVYEGYYKLYNKTREISTADQTPIQHSLYWLGYAPVTYIEIDEAFQKQFWVMEDESYVGLPLAYCPLQEVKFVSPFIPTGRWAFETTYYLVCGYLLNIDTADQDMIFRIPAKYESTFGSPDDILTDYSSATFWGVINAANQDLETSGSSFRIRVETWE